MTTVSCPRCSEPTHRAGNAMDGCPAYLCVNAHLTHDPQCPHLVGAAS